MIDGKRCAFLFSRPPTKINRSTASALRAFTRKESEDRAYQETIWKVFNNLSTILSLSNSVPKLPFSVRKVLFLGGKFMMPVADFTFKKIFSTGKNNHFLIGFLKAPMLVAVLEKGFDLAAIPSVTGLTVAMLGSR